LRSASGDRRAGFLGSHLCERLVADGAHVLCADNFFTGSHANLDGLRGHPRFELIRHDVCFPLYVEVDEIYNLACPASPIHYQRDPVQTTKTSVLGAINMLGLAKRVKARIFQASTSEIYGDPLVHPAAGGLLGQRQRDRLPVLLRRGQALRRDPCSSTTAASTGSTSKVARIFNTYGPRMHPN
jgi:UDP-glucuronate decarboxylase